MAKQRKKPGKREGNTITLSVKFAKQDVTLTRGEPYTTVQIKRGVRWGEPGQPALPWQKVFVAIPFNASCKNVEIKAQEIAVLAQDVLIEPLQPNVPTLIGARVPSVGPDSRLYAADRVWPEKAARLIAVRHSGRFALAEIEVCPFRYHLRKRKLELAQRLEVTLTYTETRRKRPVPDSVAELRYEKKLSERVKARVINPADVPRFAGFTLADLPAPAPLYPEIDYVIVTSSALAAQFQRLALWRQTLGLRARVVTVEDLLAGTVPDTGGAAFWHAAGYTDGPTRDVAEAIRNFTKWASVNWLTDHVLLGGDTEIIPVRQAFHTGVGLLGLGNLADSDTRPETRLAFQAQASSEKPGAPAYSVLDDNAATVWECVASDAQPWIRLVLQTHTPINRVELQWGASYAGSYTLEVSFNGTTWTSVYSTTTGTGGTEQITFPCASASFVRLQINSGTSFSLASMRLLGPWRADYGGTAYALGNTVTRVYLSHSLIPNPGDALTGNLILITAGPHAGLIVPYNPGASDTTLGWRFVEDLLALPGTVSTTATRFVEIRGPQQYQGQPFAIKDDYNYIPADLYYADIAPGQYPSGPHHDWDADNNGVYGELYGGGLDAVNTLPDLYLGRAPVETAEEVDNFIDKIIRYERYLYRDALGLESLMPQDFAVAVLLGSANFAFPNTPGVLDGSPAGRESIRRMLLTVDPNRWSFVRRYEDAADVPTADQGPDLDVASNTEIVAAIKDNKNIVALSSHGSSGGMCYLGSSDVDDVENLPGIWYGNSCLTNKFDVVPGEAFGEMTILNTVGGAVAYVGNSRYGWTGDAYIEEAFWREMTDSALLGEMFHEAKLICHDWEKYSLNLLGDPGLRVWSDRPQQIQVAHAALIYTGSQSFLVTVTTGGTPVADAIVCLTMPGTVFAKGATDAAGQVSLSIAPSVAGLLRVAVSGKNLIPYLGSVTVKKAEGACRPAIWCGPQLTCLLPLSCKPSIICPRQLSCKPSIICGTPLTCGKTVTCRKPIFCGSQILCGELISCGAEILCNRDILCRQPLGCLARIGGCGPLIDEGCPKLMPDEWGVFRDVIDIWSVRDLDEFMKITETPDYEERLRRLPPGVGKAIRMMVERIRQERTDER